MFESLRTDGQKDAMRYLMSLTVSMIAHTAILGALVFLPLLFLNVVQADELIAILIEPPSTRVTPPPPAPPVTRRAGSRPAIFKGPIDPVPKEIPDGIHKELEPPASDGLESVVQAINTIEQGPTTGTVIDKIIALNSPKELPVLKPPVPRTPIRVSGPVQAGKLINKVSPIYPELAIRTRTSGTVTLEALIDEEGTVTNLKILSGHPLLTEAAYSAVRQWKYLPTMIGGEPVQVVAVVTVIFSIR